MKRMTKALIGLAVGAVCALGVAGISACGEKENTQTLTGEYHYANAWGGADYGVKVQVVVGEKTKTIKSVSILKSDYTQLTPSWGEKDPVPEGFTAYQNGEADLLKKYEGLAMSDVLAIKVATQESGQPEVQTSENFVELKAGETELLIDGATQSSARLVLAVQNALENFEEPAAE